MRTSFVKQAKPKEKIKTVKKIEKHMNNLPKTFLNSTSFEQILQRLEPVWEDNIEITSNEIEMKSESPNWGFQDFFEGLIQRNNVHNWKTNQKLELNFTLCNFFHDNALASIGSSALSLSRNLKQLKLKLRYCRILSDEGITSIVRNICRHLVHLEKLMFDFGVCERVSDIGVSKIVSEIAIHLPDLKGLDLSFYECKNVGNDGIMSIARMIGSHSVKLKHFSLDLTGCKITNESFEYFTYKISKYLVNLEELSLGFGWCHNITVEGFKNFNLQNFVRLRRLHLNFEGCYEISSKVLRLLLNEILPNVTNLKEIALELNASNLTDKDLELFSQRISNKFSHLSLTFEDNKKITDEGIGFISAALSTNFVDLQYLSLKFSNCNGITGLAINDIISQIARHSPNLRFLRLQFSQNNWRGITVENLDKINKDITSLRKLQYLSMNFIFLYTVLRPKFTFTSHSRTNYDQEQAFLTNVFENLTLLRYLSLGIKGLAGCNCSDLDKEALKRFGTLICNNLKDLKELHLFIGLSSSVKKVSINAFKKKLEENLDGLKILNIQHD